MEGKANECDNQNIDICSVNRRPNALPAQELDIMLISFIVDGVSKIIGEERVQAFYPLFDQDRVAFNSSSIRKFIDSFFWSSQGST